MKEKKKKEREREREGEREKKKKGNDTKKESFVKQAPEPKAKSTE